MKKKMLILILAIICGIGFSDIKAQSLVIRLQNGNENSELLNSLRKLTFSVNDLLVAFNTGATETYGLADIQKLYFDTNTGVNDYQISDKLNIFPNPADLSITVQNLPKGTYSISIYRADGKLMLQQPVTSSHEVISISHLPGGLYLLNANGYTAKFIRL